METISSRDSWDRVAFDENIVERLEEAGVHALPHGPDAGRAGAHKAVHALPELYPQRRVGDRARESAHRDVITAVELRDREMSFRHESTSDVQCTVFYHRLSGRSSALRPPERHAVGPQSGICFFPAFSISGAQPAPFRTADYFLCKLLWEG
jgi:hypothetical protein